MSKVQLALDEYTQWKKLKYSNTRADEKHCFQLAAEQLFDVV